MMNRNDKGQLYYANAQGGYTFLPLGIQGEQMAAKAKFAQAVITALATVSPQAEAADDLSKAYFDLGTFTDADVASLGITAAQLASMITALQQLDNWAHNRVVATGDYQASMNIAKYAGV